MTLTPLVSVIMAEYKTPDDDFLASLESILNQTFKNFEFIIIDDSGISRVKKLIAPYRDKRIRIIENNKNLGLTTSLNSGLAVAKGKFVIRMDTDDISYPDRLYKQVKFIEKHPEYSVVSTRAIEFYDDQELGILGKAGEKTKKNISRGDSLIHPGVIMNRLDIIKIGGYDNFSRAEDLGLWLKLLLNQKKLYVMEDVLLKYRVNPSDYTKRNLLNRKGEIAARLKYYPQLNVGLLAYLVILKSLIAGVAPKSFVRLYRNKFALQKIEKVVQQGIKSLPTVTVIVPVYNLESFIKDTLNSIYAQTMRNFELIIINDGSTDGTAEILEQYAMKHKNMTIVNNINNGVSNARNIGLSKVKSKYFTFVDGDDIIHPQYLSEHIDAIEKSNADIAISYLARYPKKMRISKNNSETITPFEANKELLYGKKINNSPCAKLYRTATLGKIRFNENLSIGEDMEYIFRCIEKSKSIVLMVDRLYAYVPRNGSAMNQQFNAKRADSFYAAQIIYNSSSSAELLPAKTAKVFIEAVTIASLSYKKKYEYFRLFSECTEVIKVNSRLVLRDNQALYRHRLYAAMAIINSELPIHLFLMKAMK
jgi:glycosyltransferase EpsE